MSPLWAPASAPPDLHCEAVWRRTFLAQFSNPHDREPTPTRDPESISDRPLGAELRDAVRIARRLADHHPSPQARRLYRQFVEHVEGKRVGRT